MPALWADFIPPLESSKTKQFSGKTSSAFAAAKYGSGFGFPFLTFEGSIIYSGLKNLPMPNLSRT